MIDLQTLEVVNSFSAPGGPDCMDVRCDLSQTMVTSRWSRTLSFIDVASRKRTPQINTGRSSTASGRSITHHANYIYFAIYLIATCACAESAKAIFDAKKAASGVSCKPVFLMCDAGLMKVASLMVDVLAAAGALLQFRTCPSAGPSQGKDSTCSDAQDGEEIGRAGASAGVRDQVEKHRTAAAAGCNRAGIDVAARAGMMRA